jgi:N-acetylglutamate synthase/N-acetylornithine aminotransferase
VELVGVCRLYASELAINEMTMRNFTELQHYLETGTQSLLDSLRRAGEGERRFLQSQVDAAVRFCAKVFGPDYASVLAKAAEVAANTASQREAERKAAKG